MTRRALVLGGGGITGIAWEIGLLTGLAEAGVDLTTADRVVGTSAGSVVGAQVTSGRDLETLYRAQLEPPGTTGPPPRMVTPTVALRGAVALLRARGDAEHFGRVVGRQSVAWAARGRTATLAQRYAEVAPRIAGLDWNDRDLVVTAVDAATGELATFGPRGSAPEVSLEDAVNASCAGPGVYPPVPVGGRVFVDGGTRSATNADLAAGCDPVVVLAPADGAFGPVRSATQQLAALGVRHLVITPDPGARAAIGRNFLDPAARVPSARAGRAQAVAHVDAVRELWG